MLPPSMTHSGGKKVGIPGKLMKTGVFPVLNAFWLIVYVQRGEWTHKKLEKVVLYRA